MFFSVCLPFLVAGVGFFLLLRLRFFYILHPIRTAGEFISELHDRDARRSLFLALAGTLGVGNIFGVSAGIMIGGAGSIFWLFVSSFFAMIIKYAETLLSFDAGAERGGMAGVIKMLFGRLGDKLSYIYAALTVLLSFFMGASMQGAALIDVAYQSLLIKPYISLTVLLLLLTPCFFGNGRKIESITEIIIPLTTMIYIIMCFCVIFINHSRLGSVLSLIINSAFDFKSAVGGGLAFATVREGFSRGILSNEAGAGTSAMAHSRSQGRSPHKAGLFAMCEVIFDSTLLCTLTGLVILLSVEDISAAETPMALVSCAFGSVLGKFSYVALPLVILFFAYATIICWYYYGMECISLYFPWLKNIFPLFFVLFICFSRAISGRLLLYLVDLFLFVMSAITLSLIVKKSKRIAFLSKNKK